MSNLLITAYGAKGDGATDSTAAIQAAITAAQPGDTVVVPAGVFMINSQIGGDNFASGGVFLKSDINLSLAASGSILRMIPTTADHGNVLTAKACHNLTISGPGLVQGDRRTHVETPKSQFCFGLSIWGGCENITVRGPTFMEIWGDGLTVIGSKNTLIDHCTFDSCRRQNASIIDCNGLTWTNNLSKNAEYSGLDLEADANNTIQNVLIQYNNFVASNAGNIGGVHLGVGSAGTSIYKNIKIADCQFDLRQQPIFVHDNGGNTGTPWWAFLYNRIFYQGLHLPTYRFVGYPTSWSGP